MQENRALDKWTRRSQISPTPQGLGQPILGKVLVSQ
jgi:hypothetical protein